MELSSPLSLLVLLYSFVSITNVLISSTLILIGTGSRNNMLSIPPITSWSTPTLGSLVAGIVLVYFFAKVGYQRSKTRLPDVPLLRISSRPGYLGELDDIMTFIKEGQKLYEKGYKLYSKHGLHFMVTRPKDKCLVVAPKFIEELRRAPKEKLNNLLANNDSVQFQHTLHPMILKTQFQVETPIQKNLTQSLGPRLLDIVDEAKSSFDETFGTPSTWKEIGVWPASFNIVTRTANRLLFGTELARNEDFLRLSISYTDTMFGGAQKIRNYPEILKPIVMWWKTDIGREQAIARKHLLPIIKDRLAKERDFIQEGRQAEWNQIKPQDAIQWVLDAARTPKEREPWRVVIYMLHINIAAVHTSSVTFIDALYRLAAKPQIHEEMREEIANVMKMEGGWTKQGLTRMTKMDSFMCESSRFSPMNSVKLQRLAMEDFHLSDGTLIPAGTQICVAAHAQSMDPDVIPSPEKFDWLRQYRQRQQPGHENQHQFVMTSDTFLYFGHGKYACPGRFFAANEIKVLLVLFIMEFDVKLGTGATEEELATGNWINATRMPCRKGTILFKKRLGAEDLEGIL